MPTITHQLKNLLGGLVGSRGTLLLGDNIQWTGTQAFDNTATFTGAVNLASATVTNPTRTATFDLSVVAADGAALAATETAGTFFRNVGTNQLLIQGEEAISETEASVGWAYFRLPQEYLAGGTISIVAGVDVTGSGTLGTCTIDFEARLQSPIAGSVGSDLVTTAAQAISATEALKTFTVTPTGLVPGDVLVVKMTTSVAESAGSAIRAVIPALYASIQVDN